MDVRRFDIDDPEIARFLEREPHHMYQAPRWCRTLQEGLDYPAIYYGLVDGGRVVAALPGVAMNARVVRLFYGNLPYGGIVGPQERVPDFVAGLKRAARRDGCHLLRICRGYYDRFDPLEGARTLPAFEHILHFDGLDREGLWMGFKGRVRRDVRKAEKSGVAIEEIREAGQLGELLEMYRDTMVRNHSYVVWRRPMLEKVIGEYVNRGDADMLLARWEGRALAGLLAFYDGPRCFYFLGASRDEQRPLCATDLLVWTAIARAADHGCQSFNFMTSDIADHSLSAFKSKWNCREHGFAFYEYDLSAVRCLLWKGVFRVARSRTGAALVRLMKKT